MTNFITLERRYSVPYYQTPTIVIDRACGAQVYDIDGNMYLDMHSSLSSVNFGHAHPRLLKCLYAQASKLAICSRSFCNTTYPLFVQKICEMTGMDMAMCLNSGTEAVETAIKAARAYGYQVKKIPYPEAEIISMTGNFHGRTLGSLSLSNHAAYRDAFEPLLGGIKIAPFGDFETLEKMISFKTCAVITEPIQGEGGIIVPPKGWLKAVETLCRKHDVLLIVDEIQAGMGRAGALLASSLENVHADIVTLGKSLGGGLLPISAVVGKKEALGCLSPGSHGTTFGGNSLAAAVALEALMLFEDEKLGERSLSLGDYLLNALKAISSPLIQEVRGQGLWIGLVINPEMALAKTVCDRFLSYGILTKNTRNNTIRIAPPLTITKKQLDDAIYQIEEAFLSFRIR